MFFPDRSIEINLNTDIPKSMRWQDVRHLLHRCVKAHNKSKLVNVTGLDSREKVVMNVLCTFLKQNPPRSGCFLNKKNGECALHSLDFDFALSLFNSLRTKGFFDKRFSGLLNKMVTDYFQSGRFFREEDVLA